MYSRCIRCSKALGSNAELAHLTVGRRVAFDSSAGRLWVVCPRCDQWNLVPIEERWEALAECERIAAAAESRGGNEQIGFARTETGLELFRVGGLSNADIANWRYGRRLVRRQSLLQWTAVALGLLAVALSARAGLEAHSMMVAAWVGVLAVVWMTSMWRHPPHVLPTLLQTPNGRLILWPWQRDRVYIEGVADGERPTLVIPRRRGALHLRGRDATHVLAGLLPRMNGASCAEASVARAVARVREAERGAARDQHSHKPIKRRLSRRAKAALSTVLAPWELLVARPLSVRLSDLPPEERLALEMAVTEDVEQTGIDAQATDAAASLPMQEEIARIADDLLVPEEVSARLREVRGRNAPSDE